MRTVIVTTSYPLYEGQAAGHFVASEARRLAGLGHDVTVIAPGPTTCRTGSEPTVLRLAGGGLFGPPGVMARLREKPFRGIGGIGFLLRAQRTLSRLGPFDQLIGHWLLPSVWPLGVGHASRVEGVVHGSDVRLLGSLPKLVRGHVGRQLLAHRVTLRCVSEHLRETLLALTTSALRAQTLVEPVALDLASPPLGLNARRRCSPDGQRDVVIVARLVPSKRVQVALEAVALLPDVRVTVVGAGPLEDALRMQFPNVRFTGELPRPEALQWIAGADVLVSASLLEGAPLVVREARALGVPVVACPAADLERWAEDDADLWVLPGAASDESR